MRRIAILIGLSLLLTSCSSQTAHFRLTFDQSDPGVQAALTLASLRVIERRLDRVGESLLDKTVTTNDAGTVITLSLESSVARQVLEDELTQPFTLAIMREAPADEAEIIIADHGGFAPTGVTESDIIEAVSSTEQNGARGRVELRFTEEGRKKMQTLFQESNGKVLGLFVRGKLMSKLLVDTDTLKDDIVIRDIPEPAIAEAFADDVNVGMHVTFSPL